MILTRLDRRSVYRMHTPKWAVSAMSERGCLIRFRTCASGRRRFQPMVVSIVVCWKLRYDMLKGYTSALGVPYLWHGAPSVNASPA